MRPNWTIHFDQTVYDSPAVNTPSSRDFTQPAHTNTVTGASSLPRPLPSTQFSTQKWDVWGVKSNDVLNWGPQTYNNIWTIKLRMKLKLWCSKHSKIYKRSQSEPTQFWIVLFIWQAVWTLNSGHHQAMTQEFETYIETESVSWRFPTSTKIYILKIYAKYTSNNSFKKTLKIKSYFI